MESLRQKLDLVKKNEYDYSQDKEVVKYANKLESQQKKEHRKEEARQKKIDKKKIDPNILNAFRI